MSDGDGSLSPDEIDALLQGTDDMGGGDPFAGMDMGGSTATAATSSGLSPMDKSNLEEQFNEAMKGAGAVATTLVSKTVTINNATIDEVPKSSISIDPGSVNINIMLGSANSCLVFSQASAKKIAMLMFGGDSEPTEIDEGHLSSIGELANTLIANLSKNLGPKFNDNLSPSVPDSKVYEGIADLPPFAGDNVVKITYNLSIEGVSSDKLVHYIDAGQTEVWAKNFANANAGPIDTSLDNIVQPQQQAPTGTPVNSVDFTNFPASSAGSAPSSMPPNYNLLLDVEMTLTVELGRTNKYVKDVLSLGEGSIIELDKLAGEPVDLLINGKLIAKGEVVVIDENFGVRVTDIVGPAERLAQMTSNN